MDKAKQKPPQEAVAIRYDRDRENAPRVVAKGKGYVAEQLLAIAIDTRFRCIRTRPSPNC